MARLTILSISSNIDGGNDCGLSGLSHLAAAVLVTLVTQEAHLRDQQTSENYKNG